MKKKKIIIIILIPTISVVLIALGVLAYFFIDSRMYALECSRQNNGSDEIYIFRYNTFKQLRKVERNIVTEFNLEENAKDYYEKMQKYLAGAARVERNKTKVLIIDDNLDFEKENINNVEEIYNNLVYTCKKVKK